MMAAVKHLAALIVLAGLVTAPCPARADDEVAPVDRGLHGPIVLTGVTLYILGESVLKGPISPDTCRWCGPVLFDGAVRDALVWPRRDIAHQLSNATGFVGAPLAAFGGLALAARLDDRSGTFVDDALIVAESAVLSGTVNYLIKAAVGRERPFVHALADEDKPLTRRPQDNNLSFYSGHSAYSMSLAVSAGTVASMRGYRWAPAIWGTGVGLSLTTGYLRIAADKHWTTDVVVGWVAGAAIGYLVPQFHRKSSRTGVVPSATGQTVGMSFRW